MTPKPNKQFPDLTKMTDDEIFDYYDQEVAVKDNAAFAFHVFIIFIFRSHGARHAIIIGVCVNLYWHGSVHFVDMAPDTWNMCPDALLQAIKACMRRNKKPKAIIPVHLYGMPAQMDRIMSIASEYDIPVIEDAAEALGSRIGERRCGSFGDMGILSFNGNKIITTSGGGALVSDNEGWIRKARILATQARDPAPHYEHSQIGYNYRMSNVLAGIGRGQMQVLEERIAQRRANYDFYLGLLDGKPGISFLPEPAGYFSNRWLTTIRIDPEKSSGITRETLRLALEKENIEARPLWKPMHQQPVFSPFPFFPTGVSDQLFEQGLCLPSGSSLTPADRERIANVLQGVLKM